MDFVGFVLLYLATICALLAVGISLGPDSLIRIIGGFVPLGGLFYIFYSVYTFLDLVQSRITDLGCSLEKTKDIQLENIESLFGAESPSYFSSSFVEEVISWPWFPSVGAGVFVSLVLMGMSFYLGKPGDL